MELAQWLLAPVARRICGECRVCGLTLAEMGPGEGRKRPRSNDRGPGSVESPSRVRCDGLVDADAEERAGVSTSASEEPGRTDPGGSNGRAPDEPGTPGNAGYQVRAVTGAVR